MEHGAEGSHLGRCLSRSLSLSRSLEKSPALFGGEIEPLALVVVDHRIALKSDFWTVLHSSIVQESGAEKAKKGYWRV
jgi:hypothetical protein